MARDNQVAMRVSDEKKTEIRVAAAKENMDMAEFLRRATDQLLEELEDDEGNGMMTVTAD